MATIPRSDFFKESASAAGGMIVSLAYITVGVHRKLVVSDIKNPMTVNCLE